MSNETEISNKSLQPIWDGYNRYWATYLSEAKSIFSPQNVISDRFVLYLAIDASCKFSAVKCTMSFALLPDICSRLKYNFRCCDAFLMKGRLLIKMCSNCSQYPIQMIFINMDYIYMWPIFCYKGSSLAGKAKLDKFIFLEKIVQVIPKGKTKKG